MSQLFDKTINGKLYNFQSIDFGTQTGYHVNVKDDDGTRWEFSIFHADPNDSSKMKIEGTKIPSWIWDAQSSLVKAINAEE